MTLPPPPPDLRCFLLGSTLSGLDSSSGGAAFRVFSRPLKFFFVFFLRRGGGANPSVDVTTRRRVAAD